MTTEWQLLEEADDEEFSEQDDGSGGNRDDGTGTATGMHATAPAGQAGEGVSGWIYKRGQGFGALSKWQQRFVRQEGPLLSYYEDETMTNQKGSIDLSRVTDLYPSPETKNCPDGTSCFKLVTPGRVWVLSAAAPSQWIGKLAVAVTNSLGDPGQSRGTGGASAQRFDPRTGEPLGSAVAGTYDPKTGKPLLQQPGAKTQAKGSKPGQAQNGSQAVIERYDPQTGKPLGTRWPPCDAQGKKAKEMGNNEQELAPGKTLVMDVTVTEECKLWWKFTTAAPANTLEFFVVDSTGREELPRSRYYCRPENPELMARTFKPGTYRFVWDNTESRIKTKPVKYEIYATLT